MRKSVDAYVDRIRASDHSIYDPIEPGDPDLWIPTAELEVLLDSSLRGLSVAGLPLRTRSKLVKEAVCQALGYPAPPRFRRTRPRFPGQCLDVYVQKANNLQPANEEISPVRRYAIACVSDEGTIRKVRVITGEELAVYDTTGTLTLKYQARLVRGESAAELITEKDTAPVGALLSADWPTGFHAAPTDYPQPSSLLPITELFRRLSPLVGSSFDDRGRDQERNRGGDLHRLVCERLGYTSHSDDGRFPDIKHQLLEVKLQTSPTIDLGLVRPDSTAPLGIPHLDGTQVRHCDVRYALFYARTDGEEVTLTNLYLATGEGFFNRFRQFQGQGVNRKLQIRLPVDFFR